MKYSQYCSDFIDSLLCYMLQCLWSIKSYAVGMSHAYPRSVIVVSHQAGSISLLGSVYGLCVRQSVNEACYQSASMCPCQLSFHQCSTFVHQSYGVKTMDPSEVTDPHQCQSFKRWHKHTYTEASSLCCYMQDKWDKLKSAKFEYC